VRFALELGLGLFAYDSYESGGMEVWVRGSGVVGLVMSIGEFFVGRFKLII